MASTESSAPTNGNYAQDYSQPAQQAPASEIPKDEVGWYFVEQYYTTLSKSPDRLYVRTPWTQITNELKLTIL